MRQETLFPPSDRECTAVELNKTVAPEDRPRLREQHRKLLERLVEGPPPAFSFALPRKNEGKAKVELTVP